LVCRTIPEIKDYLYDATEFEDEIAGKRFDELSMVFIYGDEAILPWDQEAPLVT
jgi:hypothetical protein